VAETAKSYLHRFVDALRLPVRSIVGTCTALVQGKLVLRRQIVRETSSLLDLRQGALIFIARSRNTA
jgi:hypothetical protein